MIKTKLYIVTSDWREPIDLRNQVLSISEYDDGFDEDELRTLQGGWLLSSALANNSPDVKSWEATFFNLEQQPKGYVVYTYNGSFMLWLRAMVNLGHFDDFEIVIYFYDQIDGDWYTVNIDEDGRYDWRPDGCFDFEHHMLGSLLYARSAKKE